MKEGKNTTKITKDHIRSTNITIKLLFLCILHKYLYTDIYYVPSGEEQFLHFTPSNSTCEWYSKALLNSDRTCSLPRTYWRKVNAFSDLVLFLKILCVECNWYLGFSTFSNLVNVSRMISSSISSRTVL